MRIGIDLGGSHIGIGLIQEEKIFRKVEYNFSEEEKQNIKETIKKVLDKEIEEISRIVDIRTIEFIGVSVPRKTKEWDYLLFS